MAAAPTGKVEIEFTAGTWTDVTAWWDAKRPVTTTGGRSDTDERVQPGRLSGLMLDNTDGRFTVGNTSGAYWPNVMVGKKVRLALKDPASATYYLRFTGRIDGWPLTWEDNGATCWVSLSATDLLNDWAVADMPDDYMGAVMDAVASSVLAYWPCTRLDTSGRLMARGGRWPLGNLGSAPVDFNSAGLPGDNMRGALEFTYASGSSSTHKYEGQMPLTSGLSWSVSCWLKITDDPPTTGYYPLVVERIVAVPPGDRVCIRVKPDGVYASKISAGGSVLDMAASGVNINDKSWHLVTLLANESGATSSLQIIVDGVSVGGGSTAAANVLCDGTARKIALGTTTTGAVAHVVAWQTGSTQQNALRAAAAGGGGDGADPVTWLTALAGYAGLPAPAGVGTTRALVSRHSPYGKALDVAHVTEGTEGGILWCDGDGQVTYTYGSRRTSAPPLALTVTAAEVGADLSVAADRANLCNEVTITNSQALTSYNVQPAVTTHYEADAVSIARNGRRPKSLTTFWQSPGTDPGFLSTRAGELLQPEAPRISTLPLDVMGMSNAQQLAILAGCDVWDLIAVTGLPTAGGFQTNWLGRIEGWTETVAVDQWTVTFNTSYAGSRVGDATFAVVGTARVG